MKVSQIGIFAIVLVVIAVALAGCTGSSPATPATGGEQSSGTTSSGAPPAGSVLGVGSILDQTPYEWVEYKMVTDVDGSEQMTVYYKHNVKTGTCSMRFEGAGMEGMMGDMTMDCSSSESSETTTNPNDVASDVQFKLVTIEPVTVPSGTYPAASKYSVTSQGETLYYWTAPGVPAFVKWQYNSPDGTVITELNGWG